MQRRMTGGDLGATLSACRHGQTPTTMSATADSPAAHLHARDFTGASAFIAEVDAILERHADPAEITDALRRLLCRAIRNRSVELPACVREPVEGRYARRVLHDSPRHGYSIVAMTWAPGQATPIHDHDGMWCVEGVWDGALEITQYELLDQREGRYRFEARGAVEAVAGSAGSLIPPHEYHTIRNPSAERIAVSVHVYSGVLSRCRVYEPGEDGWHRPVLRLLARD